MDLSTQKKVIAILLITIPLLIVIVVVSIDRMLYYPYDHSIKDAELYFFLGTDYDPTGYFILLPAYITEDNKTVFDLKEYKFTKGKGKFDMEIINGTKYLNVSITQASLKENGNYEISFSAEKDIDFDKKVIIDQLMYNLDNESNVKVFVSGKVSGVLTYNIVLRKDNYIARRDWAHCISIGDLIYKRGWNNIRIEFTSHKI